MKVLYDTWGGGWGDQEAENSQWPSLLPQDPGRGHRHTFSKVTQTLVRLKREKAALLQPTLRPDLASPQREETAPAGHSLHLALPCANRDHERRQPPTRCGVASIAPHVHATREALPRCQSAQGGYEAKGCGRAPPLTFLAQLPHTPHNTADVIVKLDLCLW